MSRLVNTRSSVEIFPPHLLAQRLCNRASYFIATRHYDEGIVLLTKALKQTQRILSTTVRQPCLCKCCNLESCVAMEQDSYASLLNNEKEKHYIGDNCQPSSRHGCKDEKINNVEFDRDSYGNYEYQHQTPPVIENQDGFVYRRPLLVPKCCIEGGQYMGISLPLIILYNLGLAHHLKAISMISQSECESLSSPSDKGEIQVLKIALQLYELAYQLHFDRVQLANSRTGTHPEECDYQNSASLRFTMIISNNLGEIHRVVGDATKHKLCLHHLLSVIILMVDCKRIVLDSNEMDGFYHNVSQIILADVCAKAA